jgi:hypothetical protein
VPPLAFNRLTSYSSFIFFTLSYETWSTSPSSLRSSDLNFLRAGRSTPCGAHSSMSDKSDLRWALSAVIYCFLFCSAFLSKLNLLRLSASFLAKLSLSYLRMAS